MTRTESSAPSPQARSEAHLRHREAVLRRSVAALESALNRVPDEVETSPQVARSVQATENRWRRMSKEFGMLDSASVAELVGNSSRNRNKASQLAKQGKILGVQRGNRTLYPSFEFDIDAGKVRPVIAEVARIAGERWDSESLLQWFCAPNGFLDGRRPVDLITDEAALLDTARKSLAEEW